MSIKRKLVLMGICIGIVLCVLTINIIREVQIDNNGGSVVKSVPENIITRAEAYRLLSYLDYNQVEREAIPMGIDYSSNKMSGWYDTYINAVWKMGLIGKEVKKNPSAALTYGECKDMIDKLIMTDPSYQTAYKKITFDFTSAKKDMQVSDFLELYQGLLDSQPKEQRKIHEDTLLVLGRDVSEDGKDRMVTNKGKYYYLNARSYEKYVNKSNGSTSKPTPTTDEDMSGKDDLNKDQTKNMTDIYMNKGINVLVCDQELIYITSVTTEKIVIHNVYVKEGKGTQLDAYINGISKSFQAISEIKTSIQKVIGDITIENEKVVKINVKPDKIHGKVQSIGKDYIEIAGYGKVPLEDEYKIYKVYGDIEIEPSGSILVGYNNTEFVVSNGKISAALITGSIKAQNIRVLIKSNGYKDIYHNSVEVTSKSDFIVSTKKSKKTYKAGDKVTINPDNKLFSDGRITVKVASGSGKIQLLSVKRACGNPQYRGSIEIAKDDNKLLIVNELPMEEYLYAVIPSEMPTSYGVEALKVQAVCARSYAYRHLMANSLSQYGAHVDDSQAYQVYNNTSENENSILAVKDTYGQVLKYNDNVIIAYYFSTSCGHTASPASVWATNSDIPYLDGQLMLANGQGDNSDDKEDVEKLYQDLSSENRFKQFITSKDFTTYDSEFSWYRWKVTMSASDIEKVINNNLATKYNANPNLILTKDSNDSKYKSEPVDTVGDLVDISVTKRDSSGIITELLVKGTENTIKVRTEYNIRALLAPINDSIVRQDNTKVDNMSLLPSAFFMINEKKKGGKLNSLTLTGGGFGHGVGMSQNAVKALLAEGKSYKDIVSYFYKGTVIGNIYS